MNPEPVATQQTYEFGPFRLDATTRVLLRDGRIAPLPPKVLDTLVVLIQNHGQLVEKEKLRRTIWPDTYVDDNSLMHNISVLRKTLGTAPDGKPYIETAPRRGYRFTGTVRIAREEPVSADQSAGDGRLTRFVPSAAGLLLLIVAAGAIWMKSAPTPPLEITPLTSYRGTEAFPTFSPDGSQVAFTWNGEKQDQFDIYVKTIGVDPPRQLTFDVESECHLQWSPDGAWLAFDDCGPRDPGTPEGMAGLYVMPASGGPKRRVGYIYNGGNPVGRDFTWTPDSRGLISARAVGGAANTGLFVFSVETTGQLRQLTRPERGGWDSDPAISPDGHTLAFVRWPGPATGDIYLLSLDRGVEPRGQPRRLTFEKDYIASLVWTNDAAELLYAAGHDGGRGVWRVRAGPGATPRQVAALARTGVSLALSRQGKLAYSSRYCDFDIWRAELGGTTPSPKPAELIASTFSDAEPKYSPDGNNIAFQSNRSGIMEIWRSNADGGAATQLTSLHGEVGSPVWSPDGSEIAFDCRLEGNVDVYVLGVRDGKVRRLTTDPGDDTVPSWSRDGKWVYFACKRSGQLEVWKVSSHGGSAVQVTIGGGFLASESVDQKSLFYAKTSQYPTALWRKSLETGREEEVINSIGNWFYFAVFGDGIYFIPGRHPTEKLAGFQVNFYDFATARDHTVAEIDKWPGVGFAISPDRRSVLFAPCETHGADLMLVENFR